MRILAAIPHFFDLSRKVCHAPEHGSLTGDPEARIEALTACVSALHQQFGGPQVIIDISRREAKEANTRFAAAKLEVVVCTTRGQHLLSRVPLHQMRTLASADRRRAAAPGIRVPRRTL